MEIPVGAVEIVVGECIKGDCVVRNLYGYKDSPEVAENLIGDSIETCHKKSYSVYRLTTNQGGMMSSILALISLADVLARTAAARNKGPEPKPVYSDRAKALHAAVTNDFGCYRDAVHKLVEVIAEEPIPSLSNGKTKNYPDENTVVVCLNNPNDHDYGTNNPVLVIEYAGSRRAIKKNGEIGGRLPGNEGLPTENAVWRYASDEEVKAFFTKDPEQ